MESLVNGFWGYMWGKFDPSQDCYFIPIAASLQGQRIPLEGDALDFFNTNEWGMDV